MKAVILAGGYGTRISEETSTKPKPMIEIGGKPILWHIMKIYSHYGVNDFVICAGYKGYIIKEYFANYFLHLSDITFDMENNKMEVHQNNSEPWKVTIIDTGDGTLTGGRLLRVKEYVKDESFCFTYGDGVSNVNIGSLIEFHKSKNKWATLTAVQPPSRFGALGLDGTSIHSFQEKPEGEGGLINGGFFVLEPQVFDLIKGDLTTWEKQPMEKLAELGQIEAFLHDGFWKPMDTLRDKNQLEEMWTTNKAPWKIW